MNKEGVSILQFSAQTGLFDAGAEKRWEICNDSFLARVLTDELYDISTTIANSDSLREDTRKTSANHAEVALSVFYPAKTG